MVPGQDYRFFSSFSPPLSHSCYHHESRYSFFHTTVNTQHNNTSMKRRVHLPCSVGHKLLSTENHQHVHSRIPNGTGYRTWVNDTIPSWRRTLLHSPKDVCPVLLHPNAGILVGKVRLEVEHVGIVGLHFRHLIIPSTWVHFIGFLCDTLTCFTTTRENQIHFAGALKNIWKWFKVKNLDLAEATEDSM